MSKGIVYIMTTVVPGLIKIGQSGTNNFPERMRFLEANGYYNVSGLKKFFAIKLDDYEDKEKMLHDIFSKHQVGESELFALDKDLAKQLLLSFAGEVVYPIESNQEKQFDEITKVRKQGAFFSFYRKGLKIGDEIAFIDDPTVKAIVCGEREVVYGDQVWRLSPLTYKIFEDKGKLNASGAYQGAAYWAFNGERLTHMPDIR